MVTVVAGGVTAWRVFDRTPPGENPAAAATGPSATTTTAVAAGFDRCGDALCPTEPLCWGGTLANNGKAAPTWPLDCRKSHVWETFAAIPLPADAVGTREDELKEWPSIAAVCSPSLLASRSRRPGATKGWELDAWPMQVGDGPRLVHCIARPEGGDSKGAVF
jgi:serine/threonine-protein kinase